ncbi:MAG: FAD-dependent thymidylate synthase [bacterium]
MEFIKQKHKIIDIDENALQLIEFAGRTCYDSRHKITLDSSEKFVNNLIKNQHTAMIEFASMTVLFVTDRSVTHELVRHRLCSFAQQSQRYIRYKGDIQFILPPWFPDEYIGVWKDDKDSQKWLEFENIRNKFIFENKTTDNAPFPKTHQDYILGCMRTEKLYQSLIEHGWAPEKARKKLSNDVATEIVIKTNFREWIHIFNLRQKGTTGRPDPTIKQLLTPLLEEIIEKYEVVFS